MRPFPTRSLWTVISGSQFDRANHWFTGPASVEAKKDRYLPEASKTGSVASLSPSVMGHDWPSAKEYAKMEWYADRLPSVGAMHAESGDQTARSERVLAGP
jgi:hypothetical protein